MCLYIRVYIYVFMYTHQIVILYNLTIHFVYYNIGKTDLVLIFRPRTPRMRDVQGKTIRSMRRGIR